MSEQAPERRGGGGGSFWKQKHGGVPTWAWGALALVGVGGIWYLIRHRAQAPGANQQSGSGSGCTDANGQSVPCQSILAVAGGGGSNMAMYEQLTSQLTGLSGQNAAILEAIKDSQGHSSRDHDRDNDNTGDQDGGGGTGGRVKVPDVMGTPTDQAENIIQRAGLNPQVSGPDAGTVVAGEIPPANTSVRKGSTVILATKKLSGRTPDTGGSGLNPGGPARRTRTRRMPVDNTVGKG